MKTQKYDIFISYRRSSYDTANLIATRLKSAGYSVFFDMETLRSGKFNEQLYNVIENCTDFLLVLPPNALDRCVNEDDWVRLEVQYAMRHDKNIIPIMLNGFVWPSPMPVGLEELNVYNALTASSVEYFDLSMEKLQKSFLKSKRHFAYQKYVNYMLIIVAFLVSLLVLAWGVLKYLSRDVCTKYATLLVKDMCADYVVIEESSSLRMEWQKYINACNYEKDTAVLHEMGVYLLDKINVAEENVKLSVARLDTVPYKISDYHSFLLYMNGVDAHDISYSPCFVNDDVDFFFLITESLRQHVNLPDEYGREFGLRYCTASLEQIAYLHNASYATFLSSLSTFPEYALKAYRDVAGYFLCVPIEYEFGRDESYYDNIIKIEHEKAEKCMANYGRYMEEVGSSFIDFHRDNNTPGPLNDRMRRLDSIVLQNYNEMKEICCFGAEDEQGLKWNKLCCLSECISTLFQVQQDLFDDGYNFEFSLTAEDIYRDLAGMIDDFQTEYPETKEWTMAAKAFYCAVAKKEVPYAGVLICSFLDGKEHPCLKVGDIFVEYNGRQIAVSEDLCREFFVRPNARFSVLRLVDGKLAKLNFESLTDVDLIFTADIVYKSEPLDTESE